MNEDEEIENLLLTRKEIEILGFAYMKAKRELEEHATIKEKTLRGNLHLTLQPLQTSDLDPHVYPIKIIHFSINNKKRNKNESR